MSLNEFYWAGLAVGALGLLAWWWPRRPRQGRVVSVVDGDTLDVVLERGRKVRVRLVGVDAPELDQPLGREALHFLQQLVGRRQVTVRLVGRDRYRRRLGFVQHDGADVSEALLRNGMAWPCASRHLAGWSALRYRLAAHEALLAQRGVQRAGASKRKPWQAASRRLRPLLRRR
jgi:endonuclease YncB( thermonuclease family)